LQQIREFAAALQVRVVEDKEVAAEDPAADVRQVLADGVVPDGFPCDFGDEQGLSVAARCLLDTSAVVHALHGHTLQKAAVREGVAAGQVLVPVFVRMEYLRGVIVNLIEMWCLIRESVTVQDAFIDWSQTGPGIS
jgi:hypothetical protein